MVTLPFNCVVPPEFVVKLVAVTLLNVVIPVLFAVIFPKFISLVKVKFPVPEFAIKSKPVPVSLLTFPVKLISPLLLLIIPDPVRTVFLNLINELVVLTVPDIFVSDAAVVSTPPMKLVLPAKVIIPVLVNVVLLAIEFVPPRKETL